jgi:hypothetical protein
MFEIRKKLVTDENLRPVAVQIDYADWLRIERALSVEANCVAAIDLAPYSGAVKLTEEPLHYQRRARSEWP